jgi:hypothetical protein
MDLDELAAGKAAREQAVEGGPGHGERLALRLGAQLRQLAGAPEPAPERRREGRAQPLESRRRRGLDR